MTAATLRRRLGCQVTLVESSSAASVGVGEATIPAMLDWIANMGIDEDVFLQQTGGTYKLAIRFDNWVEPDHRYWHPFGDCGYTADGSDLVHLYRQAVASGCLPADSCYSDFSLQKALCDQDKSIRPSIDGFFEAAIADNYAFHLDAGRLADFIRDIATEEGVQHQIGHVTSAALDETGNIQSVHLRETENRSARKLTANLFVDCSGFASVLIESVLKSTWTDWSEILLCDRAVTARVPRRDGLLSTVAPYTISKGQDAGWSWQIPLCETTGHGYVYSSRHIDDDDAEQQIRQQAAAESQLQVDEIETRTLNMRVGYRHQAWVKNCVAIGLSAGFVEPLESTGIFSIQRSIDELVDSLPAHQTLAPRIDQYNGRMATVYSEIRDFVLLHYVISRRDDTPFWKEARGVPLPPSLAQAMQRYRQSGQVKLPNRDPVFAEVNHHFIWTGAGVLPGPTPSISAALIDSDSAIPSLIFRIQERNQSIAARMPSHGDLLRAVHSVSLSPSRSCESLEPKDISCVASTHTSRRQQ